MPRARARARAALAAVACTLLAATGCSAGAYDAAPAGKPGKPNEAFTSALADRAERADQPASSKQPRLDEERLGAVLDHLVFVDTPLSADGGVCLVEAVRNTGLSRTGLVALAELTPPYDPMTAAAVLGAEDRALWLSKPLVHAVNDCVLDQLGVTDVTSDLFGDVVRQRPAAAGRPDEPDERAHP